MRARRVESQMRNTFEQVAGKNGTQPQRVREGISETWQYICNSPNPTARRFGAALMNGSKPPAPEKISLYLIMLTNLCNAAPIANEPDTEKRLDMAMERIISLHQSGAI